jgi:hypothetical protein
MQLKNIYFGQEIKIYQELVALQPKLLLDFLTAHADFTTVKPYSGVMPLSGEMQVSVIRYNNNAMDLVNVPAKITANAESLYPTAFNLVSQYPDCKMAAYSILYPDSIIGRHTDVEFRSNTHIKIHIPLSIPTGDIGFEVAGETADWSDLFAFDTQKMHSAWNNTTEPRIVFIFDLPRALCNLPDGIPWTWKDGASLAPFPKTEFVSTNK